MTTTMNRGAPEKGRRHHRILSASEARRAIFVDYEGSKDHPPTLLGYLVDETLAAGIVETLFSPCQRHYRATHAEWREHATLVRTLVDRAEGEDRVIVSWSSHDLVLMREAIVGDAARLAILERRHRNALLTARRWKNHAHPGVKARNTLDLYRELMSLEVPERFGTGVVGRALATLRGQLAEGRRYGELSDGAQEGWRSVVRHNTYDLRDTRSVAIEAAEAIEQRRDRALARQGEAGMTA